MNNSYSPNFLNAYPEISTQQDNFKINFIASYNKRAKQKKIISISMLIVFIFNMSMMTNLAMVSPALACHGDISIIKETNVDTNEKFEFGGNLGSFALSQNGQEVFEHQPGDKIYTVRETKVAGWELKDIICSGDTNDNTIIDLANNKVLINLNNNEEIICTFYNEKIEADPICGDGAIEGDETCDAGELNNDVCEADYNDNCSYCNNECELVEVAGGFCGDEIINGNEECDFNDQTSNLNCDSECKIVIKEYCGDNTINNDEICDNGDDNSLLCSPLYGDKCNYCSEGCTEITLNGPFCGDAEINGTENCDDGLNNGNSCDPLYGETCTYCSDICEVLELTGPNCGDDTLQDREECDGTLGLDVNQSCSETCTIINIEHCGDETLNNNEECDLGVLNNIVCEASYGETCNYCSDTCTDITIIGEHCGDNIVNGDEECDGDTDLGEHQSCSDTCKIISEEYCGNKIIEANEECDGDANLSEHQSCSDTCKIITEEYCGDDTCNGEESCSNCSSDCGSCGGSTPLCILRGDCGTSHKIVEEEVVVLAEIGSPYLDIGKIVKQKSAQAGDMEIAYTIFLANNGNMTAFNVQVSDTLPEGMYFSEDQSNSKIWDLGDMPSGDIESINYTVYLSDEISSSTLTNTAMAYADNHDIVSAQAELTIINTHEETVQVELGILTEEILPITGFSPQEMIALSFLAMLSFGSIARLKKYQNTI